MLAAERSYFFGSRCQLKSADRIKSSGPCSCRRCTNLNAVPVQPDTLNRKSLHRLLAILIQLELGDLSKEQVSLECYVAGELL